MMFFKTLYSEFHGKYLQFSITPMVINVLSIEDFMWKTLDSDDAFPNVSGLFFPLLFFC